MSDRESGANVCMTESGVNVSDRESGVNVSDRESGVNVSDRESGANVCLTKNGNFCQSCELPFVGNSSNDIKTIMLLHKEAICLFCRRI